MIEDVGGWPGLLGALGAGHDLEAEQTRAALGAILAGEATPAQTAAFIVALRIKGETVDELTGLVRAMLDAAEPLDLPPGTIDIVGAGGAPSRRRHALNVSTMASIVAAGAGATVCKHGNRRASSTSGSFDLLEALGIGIDLAPAAVAECVREVGVGFAFARTFHPAMRHVAPVRAELGIPTVFNVLGPLSHPGRVQRQVVGVSDADLGARMVRVLAATGSVHAMVVTGHGELDELSTTGPNTVHELRDGAIADIVVDPADLGLTVVAPEALAGGDATANADIARRVVDGEPGPARDIVVLNAAAGLVVADLAPDLAAGVELAGAAIDDGRARAVLDRLVAVSTRLAR